VTPEVRVLYGPDEIRATVDRLAQEVSAAHEDGVVLVAVLKGSVIFLADLVRRMTITPVVDFLAVSSYSEGAPRVQIMKDLEVDIAGRQGETPFVRWGDAFVVVLASLVLAVAYVLARRKPR